MPKRPFQFLKFYWQELLLAFICFFIYVLFEAFQQQFYAENFNNNEPNHFGIIDFIEGSLSRWFIWLLWAMLFLKVLDTTFFKVNKINLVGLLANGLLIGVYIFSSILLASLLVILRGLAPFNQLSELFEFYFYHKAPILFMFYVSTVLLYQWLIEKKKARSRIQELGALRYSNRELYNKVNARRDESINDRSLILEIKTGRNVHIVNVQEILWLEADDYCVKVHVEGGSHTIRNSLKALGEKLPDNFLRVHRKAIVNLEFVSKLETGSSPLLTLTNSKAIPIAQSRMPQLRTAMGNLAL